MVGNSWGGGGSVSDCNCGRKIERRRTIAGKRGGGGAKNGRGEDVTKEERIVGEKGEVHALVTPDKGKGFRNTVKEACRLENKEKVVVHREEFGERIVNRH